MNQFIMKKVIYPVLWALLYFIAILAADIAGFLHAFLFINFGLLAAVLAAWPYVKLNQKHPVFGMSLLVVAVWMLLFFLIGEGKPVFYIGGAVLAVIAEILRMAFGPYGSRRSIAASYMALSLVPYTASGFMFTDIPLYLKLTAEEMGEKYAAGMTQILHPEITIACAAVTILIAWLMVRLFAKK